MGKMKMSALLASLFFLWGGAPVYAKLFLDIRIVNKKGIDKGLTLTSELHSVEEVKKFEPVLLEMKNSIKLKLKADFIQNFKIYGPSSTVVIFGEIYDGDNKLVKSLEKSKIVIEVGSEHMIVHEKPDQLLEVTIRPKIF